MSRLKPFVVFAVAFTAAATLFAQTTNIKLATIVPTNSSWHKALLDMGAAWTKDTGGRVKLTVYENGAQGNEKAVTTLLRSNQLQAGLLLVSGLAAIDESFNVFGMPFFFQTDDEANHVRDKMTPVFEKALDAKGFKFLAWGSGGWIQLFSKQPIRTLDEVRKAKLFTSQGDDKFLQWYKTNGFNPIAIPETDIKLSIGTGMINAVPMPPYPALVLQIFADAKYMLDIRLAPLFGAIVVNNSTWNKLSAEDRTKLLESAKAFEKHMTTEAPDQDAKSLKAMQARGLTVTPLDPKARAEFEAAAAKILSESKM